MSIPENDLPHPAIASEVEMQRQRQHPFGIGLSTSLGKVKWANLMADSKKDLDHGVLLSSNRPKNFHVLTGMLRRQVYAKCEDFFFQDFFPSFFQFFVSFVMFSRGKISKKVVLLLLLREKWSENENKDGERRNEKGRNRVTKTEVGGGKGIVVCRK